MEHKLSNPEREFIAKCKREMAEAMAQAAQPALAKLNGGVEVMMANRLLNPQEHQLSDDGERIVPVHAATIVPLALPSPQESANGHA